MKRIALGLATLLFVTAHAAEPLKTFRYAWPIAETTFDPQKIIDLYSNIANNAMFDTPLKYDYLARPLKLIPSTLTALPEITDGGRTLTMHVKPGIYFADDPAFGGKKRELVAEDYVYSIKRLLDPKLAAPLLSEVEGYIVGVDEALAKARKANHLDYDEPIEGLRALDRYTWQIKLTGPIYVWIYNLADCRIACAVAREVVEKYGNDVGAHPVGTGPYRLTFWKRSSKMVFEKNPAFREEYYDAQPNADDTEGQALLARFKGRRLPMVDRIEVYIIEESQPRWLSFQNEEMDMIFQVPFEFANIAMPNNRIAKNLERRGIQMRQVPALDLTYTYWNMKDPVVGGYTPDKIALRRAMSLAYRVQDEIVIVRKNQAIPAQAPYSPDVAGYDPNFHTTANEYNIAKARALLDMFGYVDRDGDGWRETPEGKPLVIVFSSTPAATDVQIDELWKRSLDDLGIRMEVHKAKWPDLMKESLASKLMMWQLGGAASAPDADTWLSSLYGPNAGEKGNQANFDLPEYNRLYEKSHVMPDSPERTKLYQQMAKIVVAYAPWRINTNRILTDMWYPQVVGYRRPPINSDNFWMYIDIDTTKEKGAPRSP
ncbi:MAG: ABC transporter substrate-binding protein [Usitatibacter sp.]